MPKEKNDFEQMDRTVLGGRVMSLQKFRNTAYIHMAVTTGNIKTFPEVTVYDTSLMEGIDVMDIIRVDGHMATRVFNDSTGKRVFRQVFIADSIKKRYRALGEYLDTEETSNTKGAVPDDINRSVIVGEVEHVYMPAARRGSLALVSVSVKGKGRATRPEISCFQKHAHIAAGLNPGDIIAVYGTLSAARRDGPGGGTVQSIACRDIAVLWKNEDAAAKRDSRPPAKGAETKKHDAAPPRTPLREDGEGQPQGSTDGGEPEKKDNDSSFKEQMIKDLLG